MEIVLIFFALVVGVVLMTVRHLGNVRLREQQEFLSKMYENGFEQVPVQINDVDDGEVYVKTELVWRHRAGSSRSTGNETVSSSST